MGDSYYFDYNVFGVMDSHGKMWAKILHEYTENAQVCGMKDKEGKILYFDDEVRHLKVWCKEHNLNYVEEKREDSIWFTAKEAK